MPFIQVLIAAALGFALGCKYKDCLCKNASSKSEDVLDHPQTFPSVAPSSKMNGFSLKRIQSVFDKYAIPLNSANSFSMLLDKIEEQSYIDILKRMSLSVNSSKTLYEFLTENSFDPEQYEISNLREEPVISDSQLNVILTNNHVDYSQLSNEVEKVEFLLTYFQGKGIKRFREAFGEDLTLFINRYSANESTESLYESIMSTVRRRLQFLS